MRIGIEPRCMTKEQAAAYCSLTPRGFDEWVRRDILPGPINGTYRWDRRAIDVALDKHAGIAAPSRPEASDQPNQQDLRAKLAAWKVRDESRTQGRP